MKKIIFLFLMVLCAIGATAQEEYYIKNFGKTDDLRVRSKTCFAQVNGFMWIGTSNGVIVFDGYHAHLYPISDPDGMGGYFCRVTDIQVAPDNSIWVGTRRGLYLYNITTESLESFPVEGLPKNPTIQQIRIDYKGRLFTLVDNRVYRVDVEKKTAKRVGDERIMPCCLTVGYDNKLWMGDNQGMLYCYDPLKKSIQTYTGVPKEQDRSGRIVSITEMSDGSLALVTAFDGVYLFSKKTHTSKLLLSQDDEGATIMAHTSITPDGEALWIGTERGILIYHTNDGRMTSLRQTSKSVNSLSGNAVHSLFVDVERGVWAGTFFGGINRISFSPRNFSTYMPESEDGDVDVVREMCEDSQGHFWVGIEDGGLYELNHFEGRLKVADVNWKGERAPFNVQSLMMVGDDLWVLTISNGIYVVDTKNRQLKRHYTKTDEQGAGFTLGGITMCQQNGTIFVGSTQGVFIFDEQKGLFNLIPELAHTYAHHLHADRNGEVWVATFDRGLWRIHQKKGPWSTQQRQGEWKAEQTSFSYPCTTVVYEDSKGSYWVGTDNRGLMVYDPQSGKTRQLNVSKHLVQESINNIIEDENHNLWLNTFNGLYCYNICFGRLSHFTTDNGLPSDYLNYSAGYLSKNGRVYVGTYKGLVSFNPKAYDIPDTRLTPYILNLYMDGRFVLPGDSTNILKQTLFLTKELTLKFSQNTFAINYATPVFQHGVSVWYRYRLNPDEPWTVINRAEMLQLINLAVGTYDLELQASFNPEVWGGDVARLRITIEPPIWSSPLAIFIYVLLLALLVVGVMWYIKRTIAKHRYKKQEQAETQEQTDECEEDMDECEEESESATLNDSMLNDKTQPSEVSTTLKTT